MSHPISRVLTGKVTAWIVLLLGLLVTGAVMAAGGGASSSEAPRTVPADSESARVAERQQGFPGSETVPAVLVVTRGDGSPLGADGMAAAAGLTEEVGAAAGSRALGPIPSEDGRAALVTVPVSTGSLSGDEGRELVDTLRETARSALPGGLQVQLTGAPGFAVDTAAAFEGADLRLLLVTALVVAVLLVVTYRSPVLWLVPLVVVAVADRVAAVLASAAGELAGTPVDASTSGITSVLVFGAGTNYALLLVSRYREELVRREDRRAALRAAWRGALPAILSSNLTVVLALLTLLAAVLPNYRSLGVAAAVGLLVALAFALLVLPAALAVCGRGLFWPFVPRPGGGQSESDRSHGVLGRVAARVAERPVTVLLVASLLLAVLAAGLVGTRVGLSRTEQFRTASESAAGVETVARHFPAGITDPVVVLARAERIPDVRAALERVDGVARVEGGDPARPGPVSDSGLGRLTVVLSAPPATDSSEQAVRDLRTAAHAVDGADALVGGSVAETVDSADGNLRDLRVVVPLILAVVFVVLVVVLRAVLAPVLLLVATVASSLAALGLGAFVTTRILGFPALDVSVPLYSVLFLVALGIDYSIFLTLRAREEAAHLPTRDAVLRAVSLTGGVITSAGVVMASVFVVLGVLPLIVLTQVGVVVALGVLLDTFLVRTVVVPAMFALAGERMWWPVPPRRPVHPADTAGAPGGHPASG